MLRLAMGMITAGHALAVPGNHENKLACALKGAKVTTGHGLAETLQQLEEVWCQVRRWIRDHYAEPRCPDHGWRRYDFM